MSKFDPPAPRFNPPASAPPPPTHHHPDQTDLETEIPPIHQNAPNPENLETGNPNAPANAQGCKNSNLVRIAALSLRAFSLLFSFLSFVIIATINGFNSFDDYNYVFAVALISFIYNATQSAKGVFLFIKKKDQITGQERLFGLVDFIGDQTITYMLMSGSSVGLEIASAMRQSANAGNMYESVASKSEGGASMLFFAFLTLVLPTVISGHKLSKTFTT